MIKGFSVEDLRPYQSLDWQGHEHKHIFDMYDYDDGIERGHCIICGYWVDTSTNEIEIESYE